MLQQARCLCEKQYTSSTSRLASSSIECSSVQHRQPPAHLLDVAPQTTHLDSAATTLHSATHFHA
jgi:hypothetical protein